VQDKVRPKVTRDWAMKRVQQILDHFLLGGSVEEFECPHDEELEPQLDPADMI
jgi:hypothetical protein